MEPGPTPSSAAARVAGWVRRHELAAYLMLAFGWSWAWWWPMALQGQRVVAGSADPSHLLGLLGPAVAAFVCTAITRGRAGCLQLAARVVRVSRPTWRFGLLALSPLVMLLLAVVWVQASGAGTVRAQDFALYSGLPAWPPALVFAAVLVLNGFGEEVGWRGLALPLLQQRCGPLVGTLTLAAIWATWHLPLLLVVETYRAMSWPLLLGGFGLGIVAGSLVLAHVAHLTGGSLLAVALWHTLYNLAAGTAAGRGVVAAVTTSLVMAWALALLVLELRRGRRASRLRVQR